MSPSTLLDNKERYASVDRFLSSAQEVLQEPDVQAILGGYAQRLLSLSALGASLYVPNTRHGYVSAPRGMDTTNLVPIIAVNPGEVLTGDATIAHLHSEQVEKIGTVLPAIHESLDQAQSNAMHAEHINGQIDQVGGHKSITIPEHGAAAARAAVWSQRVVVNVPQSFDSHGKALVNSKPIMVLPHWAGQSTAFAGPMVLHETIHVDQMLSSPFASYDRHERLRELAGDELFAYYAQTLALKALYRSNNPFFQSNPDLIDHAAISLDRMRDETNPTDDPLQLSDEIFEFMRGEYIPESL
jgi:hypothetical protein